MRTVVPFKTFARLKYSDIWTVSLGAGTAQSYLPYAGNGIYDPYMGVGGHQPWGFDQLMAWYLYFYVKSCRISVTISSGDTPNTNTYYMTVYPWRENLGAALTPTSAMEIQGSCTKLWGGGYADPSKTVSMKTHTRKFYVSGVKDNSTWGLVSANPTYTWAHMLNIGRAETTNAEEVVVTVRLWYDCMFWTPLNIGAS